MEQSITEKCYLLLEINVEPTNAPLVITNSELGDLLTQLWIHDVESDNSRGGFKYLGRIRS
jgi:hypothetical protein